MEPTPRLANETRPSVPERFSQSRTAKLARQRLGRYLEGLVRPEDIYWTVQDLAPEAWATLEEDVAVHEPKVKITIRLDESVAKFYRAMGKGYQARMNRILGTYAQMKIAEIDREKQLYRELIEAHGLNLEGWRREFCEEELERSTDAKERFELRTSLEMGKGI